MHQIMYECDPALHTECSKKNCYINGGPCRQTKNLDFAKQPVTIAKMVLPMTKEDVVSIFGKGGVPNGKSKQKHGKKARKRKAKGNS